MLAGILLCSLGVLMLEVLLTRIFSFTIWYHLAYLTISTALLGFGAAGSLITAFPKLLQGSVPRLAAWCSIAAGVTMLLTVAVLGRLPLDPQHLLDEPAPFFLELFGYYAAVTVPFLFAGLAIATPLAAYPEAVNRLYSADLFGAGLGCLAAVAGLTWLDAAGALFACAAVFAWAAACYAPAISSRILCSGFGLALIVASPIAGRWLVFEPSPSKGLAVVLRQPGSELLETHWSPINRVDLHSVGLRTGGFWGRFGVGAKYDGPLPNVYSIQYDGHNGSNAFDLSIPGGLQVLDEHLLRVPYVLTQQPEVMVIGVGGGVDVLNALRNGATRVVGVELQPITLEMHEGRLSELMQGEMQRPEVSLHAAEGRHFVRSHPDRFDVIQITAVDTFSAQSTGAYVLAESYLYTIEAISDYLEHLTEDGVVSFVVFDPLYRDRMLPAPLASRVLRIAAEALRRRGSEDPSAHLMVATQNSFTGSGLTTPTLGTAIEALLIKRTPFTRDEVDRVRSFTAQNGFDLPLAPFGAGDPQSPFTRLVHGGDNLLDSSGQPQPFDLEPVTDDRPFFFHVLPWSSLFGNDQMVWYSPGSSTGLIVLAMMLVQAVVVGSILIFLPLMLRRTKRARGRQTLGYLLYFTGLGLGFLLIEISFVQKYVLLLGYPTYSLTVTICSLLVFAGLGAALSRRGWSRPRFFLACVLLVTLAMVLVEVLILPAVRDRFLAAGLPVRILVTVLLQFPLGTALGMYFPTGVELLRRSNPALIPWAWAVNGVSSVASSVLAVILGMSFGFSFVMLVAAGIYVVGTLAMLIATRHGQPVRG